MASERKWLRPQCETGASSGIGVDTETILAAVDEAVDILRVIDASLLAKGFEALAPNLDLANLSSMLGNLVSNGMAKKSKGAWRRPFRNQHPDLIRPEQIPEMRHKLVVRRARATLAALEGRRQRVLRTLARAPRLSDAFFESLPPLPHVDGIEVKVALEAYQPKSHEAKENEYVVIRYVLEAREGKPWDGARGEQVRVYEVRSGHLTVDAFSEQSNRKGDAGKTANIKPEAMRAMSLLYYDTEAASNARKGGGVSEEELLAPDDDQEPGSVPNSDEEVARIVAEYLAEHPELAAFRDEEQAAKARPKRRRTPKGGEEPLF